MQKIKLIQIISDSEIGGGSTHVLGILQNIDKNKFDCYLICPAGFLSKNARGIKEVKVANLPFRSKFDFKTILDLKKELCKIQSSDNPFTKLIIHSHGPRAGFFSNIAAPKSAAIIFTEHNYTKFYRLPGLLDGFIQAQMMNFVYRRSDHIIAVSSSVKEYLSGIKVPADKVSVINNGIDLNEKLAIKNTSRDLIIGTIGNLNPQKGHIYLIRALPYIIKKYPTVKLEIIGEGSERDNILAEIRRLNLQKNVSLLGHKIGLPKYLSNWDVFVSSSISETFGISILEAMNNHIPVVVTKSGGVTDIVRDKMNGLLVERKNPELLAKAIVELLSKPTLAANLAKNALKDLPKFCWPSVIEKLEDLYHKI